MDSAPAAAGADFLYAMNVILYDLDGTLADTRGDLAESVNHARVSLGLAPLALEEIIPGVGNGVRKLIERSIPERPDAIDGATAAMVAYYAEHPVVHTALYPGVAETLAAFRDAGWRQAVVTNKLATLSRPILRKLGVLHYFDAVVGGESCPAMKPDPAPLFAAIEEACGGVRAGNAWMAGDNVTDLEAARRASIRSCFCRFGFGDPRGEKWDLAVDSFGGILSILSM